MDGSTEATTTEPAEPAEDGGNPMSGMPPEMAAAPQPFYAVIRETSPVMPVEGVGVVLATRAEADVALRDPALFSSGVDAVDLGNIRPLIPLQIDPPDHLKYRRILDPLFAPKRMALLEPAVTKLVNELIDGFIERGEVDFSQELSVPFPSQVFLTLLGLPLDDLSLFLAMKDGIIRPDHVTKTAWNSEPMLDHQRKTAASIYEYFDRVLDERETEPRDDLLTHFLAAEVDGQKLTRHDILDICFLFLIAGLDTVSATLDCMFGYFVHHPEARAQLAADPTLIPSAIEELLRWETPVMGVVRIATADTEIGGCPVHKGDQVMVMLGSANTDDADVADLGEVQLDRQVNRHLAFGGGIHRCLGSNLARLELRVALREWHRRIPAYELVDGHELVYTPAIRSIEHFPLVFPPGRREG